MITTDVVLVYATALALVSLVLVLRARLRAQALVGRELEAVRPGGVLRHAGSVALAAAGLAAVVFGSSELLAALPLVALAIAVNQLRPRAADRVSGERGVRVGWTTRAYAELEEWRLTGDHLRLRLFGEWTAVPLSHVHQAPIRALLSEHAADRESDFNQ